MRKNLLKGMALTLAVSLGFALCACSNNTASGKKVYKVGITQITDHPSLDNCRKGFIEGLKNQGLVEGENVEIEFKSAQNDMSVATQISQNFVSSKKDLVCGIATPSAQSLYSVCKDAKIPVIFNAVSDPIAAKLAVSETENMEGITGVSDKLPVEAQLQLIRSVLPEAKKIGILYTTSEDNSVSTLKLYDSLASKYGFEIVSKGISNEADLPQAIASILTSVDCISNMTDNTVVTNLAMLLSKANEAKIPVFGSEEEQVKNGCIACAGLDYFKLGVQAGEMAAKVLKGEDISNIHFETLKESSNFVNSNVASSLGIEISADVLKNATEIK